MNVDYKQGCGVLAITFPSRSKDARTVVVVCRHSSENRWLPQGRKLLNGLKAGWFGMLQGELSKIAKGLSFRSCLLESLNDLHALKCVFYPIRVLPFRSWNPNLPTMLRIASGRRTRR